MVLVLEAAAQVRAVEQSIELVLGKAEKTEINTVLLQAIELGGQQLIVKGTVELNAIVSQPECAGLRICQVPELNNRDVGEAKMPCRKQPAVARDEHAPVVDETRHIEAELSDRGGDLCDLSVVVNPSVPGIGRQPAERPMLDFPAVAASLMAWMQ